MTINCPCGKTVIMEAAPTFGQEAWVECPCGARYDATPGPEFGKPMLVCEGQPWLAEGATVVQLRPGQVVPLPKRRRPQGRIVQLRRPW
jgi:hypothetical protein